jgi:AcrR family transcriptional regulator
VPRLTHTREGEILSNALDLVAKLGYERASMEVIAAMSVSSKATLYRRWPNKAEMIAEALRRHPGPPCAIRDHGSLRNDAFAALQAVSRWLALNAALIRTIAEAADRHSTLRVESNRHLTQPLDMLWLTIIHRARTRGEIIDHAHPGWLKEICEAVLFTRILIQGGALTDTDLQSLVDDVLVPVFAKNPRTCIKGSNV